MDDNGWMMDRVYLERPVAFNKETSPETEYLKQQKGVMRDLALASSQKKNIAIKFCCCFFTLTNLGRQT